jgi:hypothetical protein
MHNTGSKASSGRLFISKIISSGKSYVTTAANRVQKPPKTESHRQIYTNEQVPEKRTDEDMVKLITTMQQIMTGLG